MDLRPYQLDALAAIDAGIAGGIRRQLGVAATGLGKAQPADEPVLTPSGWVPIGDLAVGDLVVGSDGQPTAVVGVFPQGERPVVRVEFSDGAWTRCDPEHLWAVRDKYDVYRNRPWRVLPTNELGTRWRVPIAAPHVGHDAPLPLDPYLLGVLLGDGGLSIPGRVMVHTEHALAASLPLPGPCMLRLAHNIGSGVAGSYIIGGPVGRGRNPVLHAVRQLGLEGATSHTKRVPWLYMHAPPEARLELLRGIMDADGYATVDGHTGITLANEELLDDVAALVRSLGGVARKAYKRTSWTHRGQRKNGDAWRLTVGMPECPFRWKAKRWKPRTKYQPMRQVRSVEPDGTAECVCIAVAAPDQMYVTRHYIVTHNTVIFCALAQRLGHRTLVLAHRDELITQAAAKVREIWPEADVGIVKGSVDQVAAQVVVASVQTLSRAARIKRLTDAWNTGSIFGAAEPFGLVIVDEAHHAAAASYRRIFDALDCGAESGPVLLGVTATPDRADGKGLDGIFDHITFSYDILWGIRAGYLADLRGLRVTLADFDPAALKVSGGDYEAGAAGRALADADAPEAIVAAWREHASDRRRTLVFTPTVQLALDIEAAFVAAGISAGSVSGSITQDERRSTLARFRDGDLRVVANCAVLTEGYDEPQVDCVIVARPTQSRALYAQMIGRGTRRHPDKTDCLVLDVVGASDDLSLVTMPSLFGIERKFRQRMGNASAPLTKVIDDQERALVAVGKLRAEDVDLFRQIRGEGIAWVAVHHEGERPRRYERTMGKGEPVVVLKETAPDVWSAGVNGLDRGGAVVLARDVTLEAAQGAGEDFIRQRRGASGLVAADAPWRNRRPSPGLLRAAKKWRMHVDPKWSAGELSDAIDAHVARTRQRQRARSRAR